MSVKKEMEEMRKKLLFDMRDLIVKYFESVDESYYPNYGPRKNMLEQSAILKMGFDKVWKDARRRWIPSKRRKYSIAELIKNEKDPEKLKRVLAILEKM